ncbi:MAG TPA: response regulator [Terriglobales bacterium]|nr:response regulator [Terriglobales bacterium]
MTHPAHRILCVDSSSRRLNDLTDTLQKAGFDVWTARGASDAVCLATSLKFDVMVLDQASSMARPEIWNCLSESKPSLPILVHSGPAKGSDLCRHLRLVAPSTAQQNPEVVLALLLLLLGDGNSSQPKPHEWAAA